MAAKLVYEKGSCSRCGGSGRYSYCQMHGDRCFKCGGSGVALTKAGANAVAAIAAFKVEHFSVLAGSVKAGDFVTYDGRARLVASVTNDGVCGSSTVNGVRVEHEFVTLKFAKPYPTAYGPVDTVSMATDSSLVKGVAGADWDALVAFAKTVKGVTLVEVAPKQASVQNAVR